MVRFTYSEMLCLKKLLFFKKSYKIPFEFRDSIGREMPGGRKKDIARLLSIDKWTGDDYEFWRNGNDELIRRQESTYDEIVNKFIDLGIFEGTGEWDINGKGVMVDTFNFNRKKAKSLWYQTEEHILSKKLMDEDNLLVIEKRLL